MSLRIGSRRSPLARAQAEWVADRLREAGVDCEFVWIDTIGDVDRRHLTEIGGTGVFATAVRDHLRAGSIDVAVHSLKDLPTDPAPGLVVAATPRREDSRDVLVGATPDDLGPGARVGTGSPRRMVQLQHLHPDWQLVPIRGNVDSRLDLVAHGDLDAVVLAAAGLRRLGYWGDGQVRGLTAAPFALTELLPAPGQGSLGVEVRDDDETARSVVALLDDADTRAAVVCERAFLNELGAGCLAPVGVAARVQTGHDCAKELSADALMGEDGTGPGRQIWRVSGTAPVADSEQLGRELAQQVTALAGRRDRM